MKKTSFLMGTLLLAAINFIVRALGFAYRIILSRMIGSHAIGLYQMVFPFLMMVTTLTTAGIPIAVSKLVAKENARGNRVGLYRVLSLSLLIGGGIAALLTLIVSLKTDYIVTHILKNELLYYPFLWSIPAIGLITFSSIFRGFYYGLKDIKITSMEQIIEQISRISFVLLLLYYVKPVHPTTAATIAIIGMSVGEFLGLLFLVLQFNYRKLTQNRIKQATDRSPFYHTFWEIIVISAPITLGRLIAVFMQTVNSILVPQRLELSGMTGDQAMALFGKMSGMASPILYLPFTITVALSLNIIPNLSEEMTAGNLRAATQKINLALKMTFATGIPTTALFVLFGSMISSIFYQDPEVGFLLSALGYATLFLCMQNTLAGILHGLGKQVATTVNYLLGMLIQLYCTYFLVANPAYGVKGYIIGYIGSSLLIFVLHFITLFRCLRPSFSLADSIFKPVAATLAMLLVIWALKDFYVLSAWKKTLSLCIGLMVYVIGLSITGALDIKTIIKNLRT